MSSDNTETVEQVQQQPVEATTGATPDVSGMTPGQMAAYIALLEAEIKQRRESQTPGESEAEQTALADMQKRIAELEQRLEAVSAERDALVRKLDFLRDNPDMAPYLSQFSDLDPSVLERFATLLRSTAKPKPNVAAAASLSGRIAQRPPARFQTADDIERYVKSATSLAEREQRLNEIRQYLQGGA